VLEKKVEIRILGKEKDLGSILSSNAVVHRDEQTRALKTYCYNGLGAKSQSLKEKSFGALGEKNTKEKISHLFTWPQRLSGSANTRAKGTRRMISGGKVRAKTILKE